MRPQLVAASTAAIAFIASAAFGGSLTQVVPDGFGKAPGGTSFVGPHATGARTYQLLIHESMLSGLVGKELTGITWRAPGNISTDWPVSDVTYSNYDIYLSGSVDPADRSPVFGDNVVGPQTQVRSGALTVDAGSYTTGMNPNEFGVVIPFSNYLYTGGNLLVEISHTGNGESSRSLDAISASQGGAVGYGTLFSALWKAEYNAEVDGLQGNFTVTQFTFVPGPGAVGLAMVAGLVGARRRRR
ncbi:MAG: hypothetical protein ACTS3F_02835 [Phycisphaerales bacterium]